MTRNNAKQSKKKREERESEMEQMKETKDKNSARLWRNDDLGETEQKRKKLGWKQGQDMHPKSNER